MPIIYEPHVCDKPAANKYTDSCGSAPAYVHGAIWQCGECGRYWWFERFSGLGFWHRVHFWNLRAKHRIRKATR